MNDEARNVDCTKLAQPSGNLSPALGSDCSTAQGSDRSSTRGSEKSDVASGRSGFPKQVRKTELCKYFLKGSCQWGTECNFAHGISEIEQSSGSCKTRICVAWKEGACKNENCCFAHGDSVRSIAETALKTTMCIWWKSKKGCRNGTDCQFAHGMKELRVNIDVCQLKAQNVERLASQNQAPKAVLAAYAETEAATQAKAASVLGAMASTPLGLPPGLEGENSSKESVEACKDATTSQLQILGSTVCTLMAQVNYLQQQLEERTALPETAVQDITSHSAADRVVSQWQGGPSRKRRAFARARAHWLKLQQNSEKDDDLDDAASDEAISANEKHDREEAEPRPLQSSEDKVPAATPSLSTFSTPLKSNAKPFDPSSSRSINSYAQNANASWSRNVFAPRWNPYEWQGGYACT